MQKKPSRTSTRTPVACWPVPSTQKTNICSPATEALLPAALISADTAATRITAGTDSAGVPPVSSPTRYPAVAASVAPPSRRAR